MRSLADCFGLVCWLLVACQAGPQGPQGLPGKVGPKGDRGEPGPVVPAAALGAAGSRSSACVNGQMSTPGAGGDPCQQDNQKCVELKGDAVSICSGGTWGQCICMAPPASPSVAGSGSTLPVPYRPLFWVGCGKTLDLLTTTTTPVSPGKDGISETGLDYVLTLFSNGDVSVSCTAAAGSAQDGSAAAYYPTVVPGAAAGGCIASVDLPPFTVIPGAVGAWNFQVRGGGPRAVYLDADPGHPLNGFTYAFTDADCNPLVMGSDALWQDTTLTDVFN